MVGAGRETRRQWGGQNRKKLEGLHRSFWGQRPEGIFGKKPGSSTGRGRSQKKTADRREKEQTQQGGDIVSSFLTGVGLGGKTPPGKNRKSIIDAGKHEAAKSLKSITNRITSSKRAEWKP